MKQRRIFALVVGMALGVAACRGGGGSWGGRNGSEGSGGGGTAAARCSPFCEVAADSFAMNVQHLGVVESGFLVGSAVASAVVVEVSLDGGPFSPAIGTNPWQFQLPTGAGTWRDGTRHTIAALALDVNGNVVDTSATITVRKGVNKDVNGDGFPDLVVGAPGVGTNAGAVYLFLSGGTIGIPSGGAATTANTILTGSAALNQLGESVALGDVNGDGYADLIAGAPGTAAGSGTVYVFHGGVAGIPSGDATMLANTILTGGMGAGLGMSVAPGDVNGDGYADVVTGAPNANNFSGGAYVFHSAGAAGIPSAGAINADTTLIGPPPIQMGQNIFYSGFGIAVAQADVNGDGCSDVAVSANGANVNAGAAFVFHSVCPAGIPNGGFWNANTTLTGPASSDFGDSVALGDVNGDGFADIAVSATDAANNAGAVYVFYSSGLAGIPNGGFWNAHTTLTGPMNSEFGTAVALGDVNSDGNADLAVTAPLAEDLRKIGAVYVFLSLGTAGIPATSYLGANTTLTGPLDRYFGSSVALSDVNGDGYSDLAVGAYGVDPPPPSGSFGSAYVFHSSGIAGIPNGTFQNANTTVIGPSDGGQFGGFFGWSIW